MSLLLLSVQFPGWVTEMFPLMPSTGKGAQHLHTPRMQQKQPVRRIRGCPVLWRHQGGLSSLSALTCCGMGSSVALENRGSEFNAATVAIECFWYLHDFLVLFVCLFALRQRKALSRQNDIWLSGCWHLSGWILKHLPAHKNFRNLT